MTLFRILGALSALAVITLASPQVAAAPVTVEIVFKDTSDTLVGNGWYRYNPEVKTPATTLCQGSGADCSHFGDLVLTTSMEINIQSFTYGQPTANFALGRNSPALAFEVSGRSQSAGFATSWRWGVVQAISLMINTDGTWDMPLDQLSGTWESYVVTPIPPAAILFLGALALGATRVRRP